MALTGAAHLHGNFNSFPHFSADGKLLWVGGREPQHLVSSMSSLPITTNEREGRHIPRSRWNPQRGGLPSQTRNWCSFLARLELWRLNALSSNGHCDESERHRARVLRFDEFDKVTACMSGCWPWRAHGRGLHRPHHEMGQNSPSGPPRTKPNAGMLTRAREHSWIFPVPG